MRVLVHEWVTGGGLAGAALPASWAAEGRAIRQALAAEFLALDGAEVVVTLDDRFAAEDPDVLTVPVAPGREEAVFTHLCGGCDYTVAVAPETGGVLARLARWIERSGGRSLGSTPVAIRLASDKWRLSRHFARHGVRTPATRRFLTRCGPPRDVLYPAVVKPRDGAGAVHTYVLEGPDDRPFAPELPATMLIQPVCPGAAMSASFLVGRDAAVRLVGTGWQEITTRGGVVRYEGGHVPAPPRLALGEPLAAVLSVPGLRGLVGVDFVRDDESGTTTVLEINPRPTTSLVGLRRLLPPGAIARAWLDALSGTPPARDLRGMIAPGASLGLCFLPDGTVLGPQESHDDTAV